MSPNEINRVIIIGAGQAGGEVAQRLRHGGFKGDITLIGEEPYPPYQRPPLSKKYLQGALDMDRPFAPQGVAPGSCAVVYAVNTMHVARDLAATLAEVREALEPGGRLVLSECVRPHPREPIYVEFIFNLMESFRSPLLHPGYRPNGGFLTPEQWTAALAAAGFLDIRLLPDIAALRDQVPGFYVAAIGAARRK